MKKPKGRPKMSDHISVTPEFKQNPDIEKLVHVLMAIAKQKTASHSNTIIAEQEADNR